MDIDLSVEFSWALVPLGYPLHSYSWFIRTSAKVMVHLVRSVYILNGAGGRHVGQDRPNTHFGRAVTLQHTATHCNTLQHTGFRFTRQSDHCGHDRVIWREVTSFLTATFISYKGVWVLGGSAKCGRKLFRTWHAPP